MSVFIFFSVVFLVICILSSFILLGIGKLLKLPYISFVKSFISTVLSLGLGTALVWFLDSSGTPSAFWVAGLIMSYLALHVTLVGWYRVGIVKSFFAWLLFIVATILMSTVLFAVLRMYISPFVIAGSSMYPTYTNGQYILIDKLSKNYKKGDAIVFKLSPDSVYYLQRIVGAPGDRIEERGAYLYVNGEKTKTLMNDAYNVDLTLSPGTYYVVGDNSKNSFDSRVFGAVKAELVIGKIL